VKTARTVMVLRVDAIRIGLQVRPKSARLTWTSASSQTSSRSAAETVAPKVTGRVRSRTVSAPVTVTPC